MKFSRILPLFSAVLLTVGPFSAAQAAKTYPAPQYKLNYVGDMRYETADYEDTLVHIGRDHNVGFVEMRAANPHLDPWIPGQGAKVTIPTMHLLPDAPRQSVVINLAEMRMYYYKTPGMAPQTYPIGIGRDGLLTPVGTTTVVRKKAGPVWTPTPRMRSEDPTLPPQVGPGPDNPMGTHALYLGFPQIAIHGTNKPYGIGRRVSSGCIRMFPEDIGRVFDQVPVGAKVTVVDQPIKAAWIGEQFYLEVHPTQSQATLMEKEGAVPDYELSDRDLAYIMKKAGPKIEKLDWASIRQVVKERKGYPVAIAQSAQYSGVSATASPRSQNPDGNVTKKSGGADVPVIQKTPISATSASKPRVPVHNVSATQPVERKPFYRNQ